MRPDLRKRFLLRAVLLLPLAFLFWHWARVPLLNAFCWAADAVWPHLFPHGLTWVEGSGSTDWLIRTGWPLALTPSQRVTVPLSIDTVARMVAGFPLLFALCLATPGFSLRRLAIGAALLMVLGWLALTFQVWHLLAIASGTQPSFVDGNVRPLPYALAVAPYPAWQVYLSGYLMYLALLAIPFITPLVLWAWLFRRFVRRLVVGVRRRAAKAQTSQPVTARR